ncbi:C1 family peptidase [Haliscomenobacter hydrossis]|uniref:Peptidase C1A papain n=1 Tax=Haliscomenobacter hydrossis (strain ATCC 27775 / DSM 1100 / LMG 10767 / O) TaxID=760192 RepID=F4KWW4_HALH1|nr:C1 family peptidase [Haliscomenobacter hydrossis]AEE53564.1 peptidase C1A papain [Haliscomenobacter hydrossis DSM 1100]
MKRLFFLTLSNLFLLAHLFAQEFPGGLILDDENTYNQTQRLDAQINSKADLPLNINLEGFCPEVRHQGDIYSCVGWAVGYAGMTIQRAIHNRCTDRQVINENAHSALFVFNQVKQDCAKGARLTDALRFLKERGDCLAKEFDFDVNDCQKAPAPNLAQNATRFAVGDYLTLFESDASFEIKVKQVKNALASFKAVIVGMSVRRNFYNLQNAKFWWPDIGNTTPAGGHAMVVVGYDDRVGAFRLFNSWGQNWGDKGYIWVKYENFAQFCKYAYIIQLNNTQSGMQAGSQNQVTETRPLTQLGGAFGFQHFTGYDNYSNQAQFEIDSVRLQNGRYVLNKTDWPIGQLFQLQVSTLKAEEYLYVLSIDAQRQIHVHFPRQAVLNDKFAGQNESALVLNQGSTLLVPGPNKALKIANPGTDRLIVLYSQRPINDLKGLAQALAQYQGDFWQHLLRTLNRHAIPPSDIRYYPQKMGFEASTRSEGYIVPLLLEVEAK